MSKEKIVPANALVVVADGGKAILFRNTGTGSELQLKEERRVEPSTLTQGPSGARPAEQSPEQTEEATFAKNLTKLLTSMHDEHAFKEMVLVADPKTLGEMRDAMHKPLEGSIAFSLSKDLTNNSLKEIEKSLSH